MTFRNFSNVITRVTPMRGQYSKSDLLPPRRTLAKNSTDWNFIEEKEAGKLPDKLELPKGSFHFKGQFPWRTSEKFIYAFIIEHFLPMSWRVTVKFDH